LTAVGDKVRLTKTGARTVTVALALEFPMPAVIWTGVSERTGFDFNWNDPEELPIWIGIEEGPVTALESSVSFTEIPLPLEPTCAFSVTVPDSPVPPLTEVELNTIEVTSNG